MRKLTICICFVGVAAFCATLYRNGTVDTSGTDYGFMPTNVPTLGDVLSVTGNGAAWISLTNFVRVWSGTSGGILLPLATNIFLSPNNTFSNLATLDAAGVTRCPVTRSTTLQNLYVVMTPAPGS